MGLRAGVRRTLALSRVKRGLAYAAFGAVLSWSFTTIAVAAKNVMSSVPEYLLTETAFTAAQWAIVAPLTAVLWNAQGRGLPAK